ncbi:MAG: flagellar basal body rod protein FlgB [Armatimonadetes bacterium]|nr:flagellar basal body rod protein FlgB [Armatimonadota bacterium]
MQILQGLFGSHINNLGKALERTSMRHELVSNNLANVNTPNYKRKDIDFSIEIERANDRFSLNKHQLGDKGIQITEGSIRRDGNSVDLESEVVALAETDLHYRMLSEMTGRYFSGLKSVIREGR